MPTSAGSLHSSTAGATGGSNAHCPLRRKLLSGRVSRPAAPSRVPNVPKHLGAQSRGQAVRPPRAKPLPTRSNLRPPELLQPLGRRLPRRELARLSGSGAYSAPKRHWRRSWPNPSPGGRSKAMALQETALAPPLPHFILSTWVRLAFWKTKSKKQPGPQGVPAAAEAVAEKTASPFLKGGPELSAKTLRVNVCGLSSQG